MLQTGKIVVLDYPPLPLQRRGMIPLLWRGRFVRIWVGHPNCILSPFVPFPVENAMLYLK